MGHVTLTTPIRGYFVIPRLTLDIGLFYPYAKLDDSIASTVPEISLRPQNLNGSRDPDHASFRNVLASVG